MNRRLFITRLAATTAALGLGHYLPALAQGAKPLPSNMQLDISFVIKPPSDTGRYHKPYVVVWVEDANGEVVKTISLWSMQEEKGKKYLPDLRKWYRNAKNPDAKSSATRSPGQYSLIWDGLNEKGSRAQQGEYTVFVEVARERGPYGRVRIPLTLGAAPTKGSGEGQGDLGAVNADYKAR